MKDKICFALIISVFLLFFQPSIGHAFFNTDLKKAKNFIKAGMYPQAIGLLEKRINDKPTDAEAHYHLGICYINTGDYNGADARFKSTIAFKTKYKDQIADKYKDAGYKILKNRKIKIAHKLHEKAVYYNPSLSPLIAKQYFNSGASELNIENLANALRAFDLSIRYDTQMKDKVSQRLYDKGYEFALVGRTNDYIQLFQMATRLDTIYSRNDAKFLYFLAAFYNKVGNSKKSDEIYTKVSNSFSSDELGQKYGILKERNKWTIYFFTDDQIEIKLWPGKTKWYSFLPNRSEDIRTVKRGKYTPQFIKKLFVMEHARNIKTGEITKSEWKEIFICTDQKPCYSNDSDSIQLRYKKGEKISVIFRNR